MSNFITIETPEGKILAEIENGERQSTLHLASNESYHTFDKALYIIKSNATTILETFKELNSEEVEVSFGIKVGAEAGIPFFGLAKASGESSFSVKFKWKREKQTKPPI